MSLENGNWRLDPFRRIQVWVPGNEEGEGADAFDAVEEEIVEQKIARHLTGTCVDCGAAIGRRAQRCQPCHFARMKANAKPPRRIKSMRLYDPIDEAKVQSVLDGTFVQCTRPERLEVLTRWSQLGRSDRQLVLLTGWNVPRDRKYLEDLNEKEAA